MELYTHTISLQRRLLYPGMLRAVLVSDASPMATSPKRLHEHHMPIDAVTEFQDPNGRSQVSLLVVSLSINVRARNGTTLCIKKSLYLKATQALHRMPGLRVHVMVSTAQPGAIQH